MQQERLKYEMTIIKLRQCPKLQEEKVRGDATQQWSQGEIAESARGGVFSGITFEFTLFNTSRHALLNIGLSSSF